MTFFLQVLMKRKIELEEIAKSQGEAAITKPENWWEDNFIFEQWCFKICYLAIIFFLNLIHCIW